MNSLKLLTILIVLLFSFSLHSSNKSLEVNISVNTNNGFPTLSIINPTGKDVNIQSISSELGSIGFEKDGAIYWLKGKPKLMTSKTGEKFHLWQIDSSTMVQLQLNTKNDEIDFGFILKTKDQ